MLGFEICAKMLQHRRLNPEDVPHRGVTTAKRAIFKPRFGAHPVETAARVERQLVTGRIEYPQFVDVHLATRFRARLDADATSQFDRVIEFEVKFPEPRGCHHALDFPGTVAQYDERCTGERS